MIELHWIDVIDVLAGGAILVLSALGLATTIIVPGMDRWNRRFFTTFFTVFTLTVASYFADVILYLFPTTELAARTVVLLEYLLTGKMMSLMMVFVLHCSGEDWRRSPSFIAVLILYIIYMILLGFAQFTTCFYYVNARDQYFRGSLHPLLLAPLNLILLHTLTAVIRRRNRLPRRRMCALLVLLIPMSAAVITHSFVYVPAFATLSIGLCALVMFAIILFEAFERYMRQQREIANQRASIMVLQMRPHFIHNTMMSIYYLCEQDPRKAQQVTLDFTTYLRRNFTAIASDAPIPFSEELEHTRAYLAVEQAQFEENIFVDYDTPHTDFQLPPLTLQPIVENAVKHGMDPDVEPLRISIQTRKTDVGSEITVSDNGPGFDPADDKEPHIALANIRQRLQMMCGGTMSILPREGGGTVVRLTIP